MRPLLLVICDSLRYDVATDVYRCRCLPGWMGDERKDSRGNLRLTGHPRLRYSYATWTAPSHLALFQGLPPYTDRGAPAWQQYRADLAQWGRWLDLDLPLDGLAPSLWLPEWLGRHGVAAGFVSSLPCVGPGTAFSRGWASHQDAPRHDDLYAALCCTRWDGGPWAWVVNTGETHYPYSVRGVGPEGLPRVPGVNGVACGRSSTGDPDPLDAGLMARLREAQGDGLAAIGRALRGAVLDGVVPGDAWVVVTSDHGELFGEDGCFGHGPFPHHKLLEVPWWEGPADGLRGGA